MAKPAKIKTLVYLAAYLPQDGESMLSLAKQDRDSKAGPRRVSGVAAGSERPS